MLDLYLKQPHLVEEVWTPEEIKEKVTYGPVNIMMGQVYDSQGHPIDLLKYSLFIMNLEDLIHQEGGHASSIMLLADHFLTDINRDMDKLEAHRAGRMRKSFLEKVSRVYHGNTRLIFSSTLSKKGGYRKTLGRLHRETEKNERFRELVLKAVPEDRRDNEGAFDYPIEELTCISTLHTDIKVGPKYERFYDAPAREFSEVVGLKPYSAIHLTDCYPLGTDFDAKDFPFGILPYKAGSKGLQDHRIDLGQLDSDRVDTLIDTTSRKDALLSIIVIGDLARQRLEGKIAPFHLNKSDLSLPQMRQRAKALFWDYIGNLFEGGGANEP